MPLDYASVLAAGQGLVPNLQEQMYRQQGLQMQRQAQQMQMDAMKREADRKAAFQHDWEQVAIAPTSDGMARLALKYPEMGDDIRKSWDMLDADRKKADLTQASTIWKLGMDGDTKRAAELARQRYEADLAAGHADDSDKLMVEALESDDPIQRNAALTQLGTHLFFVGGKDFMEFAGKGSEAQSGTIKEYNDRVRQFGKAAADEWLALHDIELVTPPWGGPVYDKRDFLPGATPPVTSNTGGGDQSTGGQSPRIAPTGPAIETAAKSAVPGLIVTSRQRSPGRNKAAGGVPDSYHLTDQARDFVPPKGMTMGGLHAALKQAFPGFDVINEGDHVHVEPGAGTPHKGAGGPVRVRSVQEANRLTPGTHYITPDGEEYVR